MERNVEKDVRRDRISEMFSSLDDEQRFSFLMNIVLERYCYPTAEERRQMEAEHVEVKITDLASNLIGGLSDKGKLSVLDRLVVEHVEYGMKDKLRHQKRIASLASGLIRGMTDAGKLSVLNALISEHVGYGMKIR